MSSYAGNLGKTQMCDTKLWRMVIFDFVEDLSISQEQAEIVESASPVVTAHRM